MRNTMGRPVAPDKDEKVKGQKMTEAEEVGSKEAHAHVEGCTECLEMVKKHMGAGKPADGMKGEDQGGKTSGAGRGHDTTPKRQRH